MRTPRGARRRVATAMLALGAMLMSTGVVLVAGVGAATAAEEACVPQDAWTETSEWLTESPGEGWYQTAERVRPGTGTDDALGADQRYSWNGGNTATKPPTPLEEPGKWTPNTTNYKGDDPIGEVFQRAQGANASWFYWSTKVITPGVPAVTEYQFGFDHPEVVCDDEVPPGETTPDDETPPQEETPEEEAPAEVEEEPAPVQTEGEEETDVVVETVAVEGQAGGDTAAASPDEPDVVTPALVNAGIAAPIVEDHLVQGLSVLTAGALLFLTGGVGLLVPARRARD